MKRSSRGWIGLLLSIVLVLLPVAGALTFAPRVGAEARPAADRSPRPARARRARARSARAPRLTPAQRRQIQRWHASPSTAEVRSWLRQDPPPLVFRARDRFAIAPESAEGGFDDADLAVIEQALASREGQTHAVHPRLVELVYRAVRHFRVPHVQVISGYRDGRATSRHSQGRALDFVLPGVSDRRLAAYLRPQGFVGVGIYPVSGFVHLDVRARSHFWTDSSGPNERNRERPMLRTLTFRYDSAARRLGVEPVPDAVVTTDDGDESEGPIDDSNG